MVLLLAVLYAYHSSRNNKNEGESSNNNRDLNQQQRQQREENSDTSLRNLKSQLSEQISLGSTLLQTTFRCNEEIEEERNLRMNISDNNLSPAGSYCEDVFRPCVRTEWIDAVFGREFFAHSAYKAPRQGVGLCNIPYYVTYTATIPSDSKGDKLGMTLSRLPLGLYVRHVAPGSEAFLAGVQENSILVDINGMGMLVEPSRQALERIWQYEGHFEDSLEEDDQKSHASGGSTSSGGSDAVHPWVREPVALTFIKDGRLYTVVMLSNPPYGISWGPCGNFALVSRSYSFAATVGVRRGSIVAAVNDENIRTMDHQVAAEELRRLFNEGEEIRLTCCYPPAAARTGHFERQNTTESAKKKTPPSSTDGVEVKFHSLEQSLSGFWGFGGKKEEQSDLKGSVSELARQVASGEIEAPDNLFKQRGDHHQPVKYHWSKKQRAYGPCPPLTKDCLRTTWDPLDAMVFCFKLHRVSYNEELFTSSHPGSESHPSSPIVALRALASEPNSTEMIDLFLLQFISLICLHVQGGLEQHCEEKKTDEDEKDASPKQNDGELTGILLKLSRRDHDFRQRLYFLLRSYIATFEEKPKDDRSRNLLALLNCLDLLRSAEKQQSVIDPVKVPSKDTIQSEISGSYSGTHTTSDNSVASYRSIQSTSSGPSTTSSPRTTQSIPSPGPVGTTPEKKRSLFRFMRKSTKKKPANSTPKKREIQKVSRVVVKKPSTEMQQIPSPERMRSSSSEILQTEPSASQDMSSLYDNMTEFLGELDNVCNGIERSLLRSFSEKITDWALQPWSASKGTVLATLTEGMRESLRKNDGSKQEVLINPVDSSELLVSVKSEECYILPSAHFPLLLTFNVKDRRILDDKATSPGSETGAIIGKDILYRTRAEIVGLQGNVSPESVSYIVHGAISGNIKESGKSLKTDEPNTHVWREGNELIFETRSSWGSPKTLSLRLSTVASAGGKEKVTKSADADVVGFGWVDLTPIWQRFESSKNVNTVKCKARVWSLESMGPFDEHGTPPETSSESVEILLKISTEVIDFESKAMIGSPLDSPLRQRMLLYKHDDDLRQEAFAIQFIKVSDSILKASGLDLKLLTFGCVPVGVRRGFIEWVPGSVPLSEICQPFAGSILGESSGRRDRQRQSVENTEDPLSMIAKAGLKKYGSLRRIGRNKKEGPRGSFANNPIQDFLRSVAYDSDAPYLIKRECMDTYVKSCAGYCVITYLLGVGDRHLDNLLLHESGCFFHCDYSFIFGKDPKKYLPMRITEDMVHGMGGRKSDNYAKFLSLTGAAFLALRRPENVRFLLSLVRLMEASHLPDISQETVINIVLGIRERMKLDLGDGDKAVAFMEKMIEDSLSSKMWIAVDAIHSLGKRF